MKYVFWTIAFLITAVWLYFVFSNLTALCGITLLEHGPAEAFSTYPRRFVINTGLLILTVYIMGSWAAIFFVKPFLMKSKEKEGAYERRLEKTSVSNDESNAKVKVLENKIQVLEKALEDALKKNK